MTIDIIEADGRIRRNDSSLRLDLIGIVHAFLYRWPGVHVLLFFQILVTLSTSKEVTGAASQQQQLKDMLYKRGNEEFLDISSYY